MSDPRARAPFCQSEALFSSYPFLALDDLSGLPEQDVQFLELNGCFHLPLRPIQEEFVHQYFLYIHPCYPLMDEGEFWSMYLDRDRRRGKEKTMSLLLLQAMLFASSAVRLTCYHCPLHSLTSRSLYRLLFSRMLDTQE